MKTISIGPMKDISETTLVNWCSFYTNSRQSKYCDYTWSVRDIFPMWVEDSWIQKQKYKSRDLGVCFSGVFVEDVLQKEYERIKNSIQELKDKKIKKKTSVGEMYNQFNKIDELKKELKTFEREIYEALNLAHDIKKKELDKLIKKEKKK